MPVPAAPGRSSWCDACMGSRRCWVCDGAGDVQRRWETADCPSCRTSGRCRYCANDEAAPSTTTPGTTTPTTTSPGTAPAGPPAAGPAPARIVLDAPSEAASAASPDSSAQG